MLKPALIIEDDPDIAESVRYNLESAGFTAMVATTGEQGLKLALDTQNPPIVIVLDLMLPGMNGMELCRRLRRESQTRRTPCESSSAAQRFHAGAASNWGPVA